MPPVRVVFYKEDDSSVPIDDWLQKLQPKARAKCLAAIARLRSLGHELRRPEADYLRDDIYELRLALQRVRYRMLYFFHQKTTVVVSHGFSKQQAKVPKREIEVAIRRKKRFEEDPAAHTFEGED